MERTSALSAEIDERARLAARLETLQTELFHATRVSTAGQMAAQIAHEVNQPLTAAANSIQAARRLLAADGETDVTLQVLDEAARDVLYVGQLVRRVRSFIGQGIGKRRTENIATIIEEATSLVLTPSVVPRPGLDLRFDPSAATIFADRILIVQVLTNLLANALDAIATSPQQQVTVTTTSSPPNMVRISVADTGVGLSSAIIERLFEPFASTKPRGMGLGLSICRSIVEAHGGTIWWNANIGGGSLFSFTLPMGEPNSHGG
jgi:two-component system sensor kinase FixL